MQVYYTFYLYNIKLVIKVLKNLDKYTHIYVQYVQYLNGRKLKSEAIHQGIFIIINIIEKLTQKISKNNFLRF